MAKHNDKEFQEKIKMTFRNNLDKQFRNGLAQGAYAVCKVVLDRANDEGKTIEERLQIIRAFCEPIVNMRNQPPVPTAHPEADEPEKAGD